MNLFKFVFADAYTQDQVAYIWKHGNNSIKISEGLRLSQFDLEGHPLSTYTTSNTRGIHVILGGIFPFGLLFPDKRI